MTASTARFSMEELQYLSSVPEHDEHRPYEDIQGLRSDTEKFSKLSLTHWTHTVVNFYDGCAVEGCSETIWMHNHKGMVYYRHGEHLFKVPEMIDYAYRIDNANSIFVWMSNLHD